MNIQIMIISSWGATNASLAKRFANAATRVSGKCLKHQTNNKLDNVFPALSSITYVELKNKSDK